MPDEPEIKPEPPPPGTFKDKGVSPGFDVLVSGKFISVKKPVHHISLHPAVCMLCVLALWNELDRSFNIVDRQRTRRHGHRFF
jgi:hypothetical protein